MSAKHTALKTLLLGCLSMAALTAQAQTSYVLTTLKPAASGAPMPRAQQYVLENTDRVVSHSDYEMGYQQPMCIPGFGCFGGRKTYAAFATYWPASTSTSVTPVKLSEVSLGGVPLAQASIGKAGVAVSPDGRVFAGALSGHVFNAAGVLIGMSNQVVDGQTSSPQFGSGEVPKRGIDNRGVVVVNQFGKTYLWDLSSRLNRTTNTTLGDTMPLQATLDKQGYPGARVNDMIGTSWMVGEVWPQNSEVIGACEDNPSNRCWPAVWDNGQMRVIDQRVGRVVATNANRQLLIRWLGDTYAVWTNGTEKTIAPLASGQLAVPSGINAAGVVVGRSGSSATDAPELYNYAGGRAFIWINGSTQDLTNYVNARGARLPSGSVLEDARAINDKGSIVAVLRNWLGTRSTVRLTAMP
ncbi:MAG: hypothetical protein EOP38_09615 [Rubrivivax sp.]|nr:MAG: hypothetical protein EOP38_09615 [Rubrivivax sp.]